MKVILKQDVKNLGEKDDMVEVKDGYARNYLIPKGLADEANEGNIGIMKARKKAKEKKQNREKENAENLFGKIEGKALKINAKAGESGKLFGSVTSMDIAEALNREYGLDLDRKKVVMDEPIRSIGETTVEVKLYSEVSAKIKVEVVSE